MPVSLIFSPFFFFSSLLWMLCSDKYHPVKTSIIFLEIVYSKTICIFFFHIFQLESLILQMSNSVLPILLLLSFSLWNCLKLTFLLQMQEEQHSALPNSWCDMRYQCLSSIKHIKGHMLLLISGGKRRNSMKIWYSNYRQMWSSYGGFQSDPN